MMSSMGEGGLSMEDVVVVREGKKGSKATQISAFHIWLQRKNLEDDLTNFGTRISILSSSTPTWSLNASRMKGYPYLPNGQVAMLLNILTAFFIAAAAATLPICLALGLLSLSQYIESHAARARRYGLGALYLLTVIQILLVAIDNVPFLPLLPNLISAPLHYTVLSHPDWPFSFTPTPSRTTWPWMSLLSLILLPLASHIYVVRHHTLTLHAWHQHRYDTLHRPKLPGGRLDWDVKSTDPPTAGEMTNLQVCAVLALCVWTIPVCRLLGRIAAAEWGGTPIGRQREERR